MKKLINISRCTWTKISIILMLVGIVMYAYPRIANFFSQEYTNITIKSFEETVHTMQLQEDTPQTILSQEDTPQTLQSQEDIQTVKVQENTPISVTELQKDESPLNKLYKKVENYNKRLYEEGQKELVDPFSYEVSSFNLSKYGIEDNMFGYLKIPKLRLTLGIYLGATATNMSKGAVHLTQTSLPIGGNNTNAVIAAHRGSRYGEMFLNIHKLKTGDKVTITNAWDTLTYSVTSIAIIAPNEIDKVLIQEGRDMVTLISCNPYGKNIQRYVVYCDRVLND